MKFTDDQLIAAINEHGGNVSATCRTLNLNRRSLLRRLKGLALKGYSPRHDMNKPVPDGFTVQGTSTLYDKDGNKKLQWVKSKQDPALVREMIDAIMQGLCEEVKREAPVKAPATSSNQLMNAYVVTDYHLGMLAWGEETGADWDMELAEDMLVSWFKRAMSVSPKADIGVFAQLGDFLHWDGWDAVTPTNRHILDADTRFPKLVRVASRAIRRILLMMLAKYPKVHVLMAEGNHDLTSSVWLKELVSAMFEHEPRLTVDMSPDPYYCIQHGKTALFFHHGHKKRFGSIDDVFVAKFRSVYGKTEHAYAHMGHLHHIESKETNLMVVEQHRTLSAPDAHASRGGWLSGRDACVISYDKRYGEVCRSRISAKLIIEDMGGKGKSKGKARRGK